MLERTFDEKKIRDILTHQDIGPNVGVDENPDFDIPFDDDHHYLLMEGGLFILHRVQEGWEMHVNVLKNFRNFAHDGASKMLDYAFNTLGAEQVVCNIPQEYVNVYNFALSFNMNDHGLRKGDHYLSLRCDQWALSERKLNKRKVS